MRILVFGNQAQFTMIEDDGAEKRLDTTFKTTIEGENVVITVQSFGDKEVSPKTRKMVFEFIDMFDADVVSVHAKRKNIPYEITKNRCFKLSCVYDNDDLTITLLPRKTLQQERNDDLSYAKKNMMSVIEKYEGSNALKEVIYNQLAVAENKEQFLEILSQSKLPKIRKQMIKEFL